MASLGLVLPSVALDVPPLCADTLQSEEELSFHDEPHRTWGVISPLPTIMVLFPVISAHAIHSPLHLPRNATEFGHNQGNIKHV